MFNRFVACILSAFLAFSPIVSQAASFGSKPAESSSSSKSQSSPKPSQSDSSGSISRGQAVGMQRSQVTQSVRDGSYRKKQTEQTTTASTSNQNRERTYDSDRYKNIEKDYEYSSANRRSRESTQYQPPPIYNNDSNVIGAAIAGYTLGQANSKSNTTVINNESTSGQSYDSGVSNHNHTSTVKTDNSVNFFWMILGILSFAVFVYIIYVLLNRSSKNASSYSSPVVKLSPPDELEDKKDDFFVNFQKNNKPSGIDYIQENSESIFFGAVRDSVANSSDEREVRVVSLGSEVVNCEQKRNGFVASVHYTAKMIESENGEETVSDINEVWHFIYDNNSWKVAGIEPL